MQKAILYRDKSHNLCSMEKSLHLQALRGLAVTLVVCFHLGLGKFQNGWVGVDIFFVVSGFLMWRIYASSIQQGKYFDFYKRRLRRLLPALSLLLVLSNIVFYLRFLPFERKNFFIENTSASFFVSNIHYWMGDQYFSKGSLRPLLNLWSISLEIQFYLFFPLIVFFIRRSRTRLLFLLLASFLAFLLLSIVSPQTAFFLLPGRFWEFLIGVSICFFTSEKSVKRNNSAFLYSFSYLILFFGLGLELNRLQTIAYQVVVVLLFSFLIGDSWNRVSAGLSTRFLAKIGDYSYSIYLIHYPLIILLGYMPFAGNPENLHGKSQFFIFFILLTLFSWISKHFVEDSPILKENYLKFWALSTVFCLVALIMPTSLSNAGFNRSEVAISNALKDRGEFRCGFLLRIPFLNQPYKSCKVSNHENLEKALLVGNSHADSIKLTVANSLPNVSLYLLNENNPLSEFTLETYKRGFLELKPSIVILHSSPGSTDLQSLNDFASFLEKRNAKFFIIAPIPRPGQDVPKFLYQMNQNSGRQDKFQLAKFSLDSYLAENRTELRAIAGITANFSAEVIPTVDLFCTPFCQIIDLKNFKPLYFDSNHLTLTGSNRLLERLLTELND